MIDGASSIDPLVAQGPLAPVKVLRPAPSLQRVVVLDTQPPQMVDLAVGNLRPYENGPPVSLPMSSTRFDLGELKRLQIQVLRDPKATSTESVLLSLHLADADTVIDVVETASGNLVLRANAHAEVNAPIGSSPAIVIVIEPTMSSEQRQITISARNAETLDETSLDVKVASTSNALVTVGGPATEVRSTRGRRRHSPVQIHTVSPTEPVDHARRVVRGARRAAGAIRGRIS